MSLKQTFGITKYPTYSGEIDGISYLLKKSELSAWQDEHPDEQGFDIKMIQEHLTPFNIFIYDLEEELGDIPGERPIFIISGEPLNKEQIQRIQDEKR